MNAKLESRTKDSPAGERTKALVLQAAIDEFAEHGLAGGRVDRVAQRAGVNKQALYYHYGDKESLFEAALSFGYSKIRLTGAPWDTDPRPATELMALIAGTFFDLIGANRNHIALIADENRNRGKHLTADVMSQIEASVSLIIGAVTTVLKRGQKTGEFAPDIDATAVYLMISSQPIFYFNHSYTLSALLKEDTLKPSLVRKRRDQFVRFVLASLRPDAAARKANPRKTLK